MSSPKKAADSPKIPIRIMHIKNSVIIVTGASAGIGRATAVALAQSGATVVVTARREERLQALAKETAGSDGRIYSFPGNIQDETFCHQLVAETVERYGRLDVLINNAGLGHKSRIAEMPAADIRTIFDTNVMGLLYTIQAAVPQMKKQGGGQIINVSSIIGQRPIPNGGIYTASKTAVNFISRTLRMELRPYNIKVTLVYPGRTQTEFGDALLGQKGANPAAFGRTSPDKVAQVIVKAIRYGRTEVYVTPTDWLFAHVNRLFPRTTDGLTNFVFTRYLEGKSGKIGHDT